MTAEITAETFNSLVIERSKTIPVLVDFWADWCGPCKMLMPMLANLASEFADKVDVVKVNTDEEQQLASSFNVRSLPTVKLFKDGQMIDEFMGALPESAIREFIEKHLDRPADEHIRTASNLAAAGQHEEAITILTAALAEDPGYDKTRLALATQQLEANHLVDARLTLNGISNRLRFDNAVKPLVARLELAEIADRDSDSNSATLEAYISKHPGDLIKRAQLGALYFSAGNHDAAMKHWLEMVRTGDPDAKESGRENLVRTFEILGPDNENVAYYRKLLAQALN